MKAPGIPADEQTRLETLRALRLLDTAPEERFDRLTRLAKRMFGVPISLVSLVDTNRQWFKSRQGLDACETSREVSFCGHAILGDDVLLIPDARNDTRFADNPLVVNDPNIAFYAGCPLRVTNGSKIGTLCLIDREPREFSEEDIGLLRDLAAMAEQEIAAVQLSTLDELTLISNRRGFMDLGLQVLSLCRRKGLPAALILFDLDGFKQINDRFGHAEGDRALVEFAGQLRTIFRDSDVFARLGGDEFAVLMAESGDDNVTAVLSRLRCAVNVHNEEAKRGYDLRFSAGYVLIPSAGDESLEQLLAQADAAMYANKRERATA